MREVEQILTAAVLGTIAFKNGKKRVPAYDKELLKLLKGRNVGETPEGEASSVRIMQEWTNAWEAAEEMANDPFYN